MRKTISTVVATLVMLVAMVYAFANIGIAPSPDAERAS